MPISTLRIINFRNLSAVDLSLVLNGINLIYGKNGSGKTNLLEAIYFIGMGRSFRTSSTLPLIRKNTSKLALFTQFHTEQEQIIPIGIERTLDGLSRSKLFDKEISNIAEIAHLLPIRIINSQSHLFFESGPVYRRKYLDWGLFYDSDDFLTCWRQYERVLKQRNMLLRDKKSSGEVVIWTEKLIRYALELNQLRSEYVAALQPIIIEIATRLLEISSLEFRFYSGWPKERGFAEALAECYDQDCRFGYTQYGPHRADFEITISGVSAKQYLSRGQQKLLICAMMLAQGIRLKTRKNMRLIYLLDDLPAELDGESRERLISLLSEQQTQIIITSIESNPLSDFIHQELNVPLKVFHVEQGRVSEASTPFETVASRPPQDDRTVGRSYRTA